MNGWKGKRRRNPSEKARSTQLLELQVGKLDKDISVVLHLVDETEDDTAVQV